MLAKKGYFLIENFINKLKNNKFITLEVTPKRAPSLKMVLDKIEKFELNDIVDGYIVTDNPLAKLKYSAILASIKIQNKFNKPSIATMSMRDKNMLALQSDLLGANDFDIRTVLALTGDPAKMSDQPYLKGVFQGNSNTLLKTISLFNEGVSYSGNNLLEKPNTIYPFCVTNSYYKSVNNFRKKLSSKIENYTTGVITQPIYDKTNLINILDIFNDIKNNFNDTRQETQLVVGLFPIVKLKTAQFLDSHVPGINIPNSWIDKLKKASQISEQEEYKVGLELSKNLLEDIKKIHPKVHLMTANNFELANKLLANW
jgi:5,10-methylenetetrahydrofolate reductase